MSEKKKPHLLKTFKGQILVFMLLWSSCQTMSYYLVTKSVRKAKNIQLIQVDKVSSITDWIIVTEGL